MKAIQKETDRKAEVNIYVDGNPKPLEEYGEYVDAHDDASCCYIPVKAGDKLKFSGRFSGTTPLLVYDTVIDGVIRNTNDCKARTKTYQKNKHLDFDTFLFQKEGDTDTIAGHIFVTPLPEGTSVQDERIGTIGNIELRIFIEQQHQSVSYDLQGSKLYDSPGSEMKDVISQQAYYRTIKPEFFMRPKATDCSALEENDERKASRKLHQIRPGHKPWLIFRFHYRLEESIKEKKLPLTLSLGFKHLKNRSLRELDPEQRLMQPGRKGSSSNDEDSLLGPSPLSKTEIIPKLPDYFTRKPSDTATPPPFTSSSSVSMTDLKDQSTDPNSKESPSSSTKMAIAAVQPTAQSQSPPDKPASQTNGEPTDNASKPPGDAESGQKSSESRIHDNSDSSDAGKPIGGIEIDLKSHEHSASVTDKAVLPITNNPPNKASVSRPPPINTALSHTGKAMPTPATPNKRLADPSPSSETKRSKLQDYTPVPASPAMSATSSTAKSVSNHHLVREMRKRIETTQKKREVAANKQLEVNNKMAPYQKRVEEEIERLRKTLQDEEAAFAEENQQLQESMAMLEEFQSGEKDE